MSICGSPHDLPVETIGSFELDDEQWSYDTVLVLMDPITKKFYVLNDSGCSCPMPFENFTTWESLGKPLSTHEAIAKVNGYCHASYSGYVPNPHEVISRILKAGK